MQLATIDDWRTLMDRLQTERWASAITAVRPEWRWDSLVTWATRNLATKPYRDCLLAGMWVATDERTTTPDVLRKPGPWWQTAAAGEPTPQPVVETCPHGVKAYANCTQCSGPRPSHDRIQAIRKEHR